MKLHTSKEWLTKKYLLDKMSPEDIAKEAGVTKMTIYRKLNEFKLLRK